MYVSKLFIRNFRGVAKAELDFGKGVNVLVGRNGSGKTTILSALRLVLDTAYGRQARILDESDIHGETTFSSPADVIIAVQLAGLGDSAADKRLKLALEVSGIDAVSKWLVYRFRPRNVVRTELSKGTRLASSLIQSDYEAERSRCVDADLSVLGMDDDHGGVELNDKDLAALRIVEIQALRDVVDAMKRERTSPLSSLIDTFTISKGERDGVEAAYVAAQDVVEKVPAFAELALELRKTYLSLANEIDLSMRVGLTKTSFSSIARDLAMLLTDDYVSDMELHRNGLGLNNLLYIAMLLETFERKQATDEIPLLLVEEPEAHLHPQAQIGLINAFRDRQFQTIVTTHSPYVAMAGGLTSVINLDRDDATKGMNLAASAKFVEKELADLDRFLAIDRGVMLFATAVILVEGPSEQILIPIYAELAGHNLSRLGIQVCAINGTHFSMYERLLGPAGLNRPFVTIKDGDAQNGPNRSLLPRFDDGKNITTGDTFTTSTTLEYALTQVKTLPALRETIASFGLPETVALIDVALGVSPVTVDGELQKAVLKAASRIGKARFAQTFGDAVRTQTLASPPYISAAIARIVQLRTPKAATTAASPTSAVGIAPAQTSVGAGWVGAASKQTGSTAVPGLPRKAPPPPPTRAARPQLPSTPITQANRPPLPPKPSEPPVE